ncbi:MAG: hypothetical protein V4631_01850 [Pseudomonadota bacterium]
MKITKLISTLAASLVAASLAGCGDSPPGDADIRQAMERMVVAAGGKEALVGQEAALARMKVKNCVKDELGGFKCEFTAPLGGTQTARFSKGAEGWSIVSVGG